MTATLTASLQSQRIDPLRVKQFHVYAKDLIGTQVYDSPSAERILGTVENFLFAPVDDEGIIVGIKTSSPKYSVLNPESVYWWLELGKNRKFAVLNGRPEPKYYLDPAISIGDKIIYRGRKLLVVDATVFGVVYANLGKVPEFPNTKDYSSEYQFIDDIFLEYGSMKQPNRLIAIKRWDMPNAIDFKNKTLLTKPKELGFTTKEEVDKILEDANTPNRRGFNLGETS